MFCSNLRYIFFLENSHLAQTEKLYFCQLR